MSNHSIIKHIEHSKKALLARQQHNSHANVFQEKEKIDGLLYFGNPHESISV